MTLDCQYEIVPWHTVINGSVALQARMEQQWMAVTFLMDAINHNPSRINCQWPTWHDSEGTWGRRRLNQSYIEFNPPADLNGPCPAQWNEWLGKKGIRKGSIIRETTTLVNIINKWSNSLLVTKRDCPGALTKDGRRGLRMCLKKPQNDWRVMS